MPRKFTLDIFSGPLILSGYLIGNSDSSVLIQSPDCSEFFSNHPDYQAKENEENMFLPSVTKYVKLLLTTDFFLLYFPVHSAKAKTENNILV